MADDADSDQAAYEARLQRRLNILKRELDAGNVQFMKGMQAVDSLKQVRYLPDGNVDLSTVDGLVRATALAIEAMHDRQETKKAATLAEVQNAYFRFLEARFGGLYEMMIERRVTPHQVAAGMSSTREGLSHALKNCGDILPAIEEFWTSAGPVATAHVEDMRGSLKGVFGGDLFPLHSENIASKCGLYTDTIVLPDPFLRSKHVLQQSTDDKKAFYLIKHGLNLLQYRDLACADVTPPIVVILPDISALDDGEKKFFYRLGQEDTVIHSGRIFGRPFASFDELVEFCATLDTVERAVAAIRDRDRVLFDVKSEGSLQEQLAHAIKDPFFVSLNGTRNPGLVVASQALGRLSNTNELLVKARRLNGTPIIDAPTSWQYFVWKLEYDARRYERSEALKDLHVVRGLQSLADTEMAWLGGIPTDALVELRKAGALGEIRAILSKGVAELAAANPTNFFRTSDSIFDNIRTAFSAQQGQIDALKAKKWKFAGKDIGSWMVVGSLAVAAAATGAPVWGLIALAADQILPAPKLRDIPATIKKLARESREVKQSPVGMLFKISKQRSRG